MIEAVAYYRSRPSEPNASNLALSLQREAVQQAVAERGLEIVAEFVEREGEDGSETYPAYIGAAHATAAHKNGKGLVDAMLIIATQAAIGSGEPFYSPSVDGANGFMHIHLQARSVPAPVEIVLPAGAPAPLCLYADCHPSQLETLIYLCNGGPTALADVVVKTDGAIVGELLSAKQRNEAWTPSNRRDQRWTSLPPGRCVLLGSLDHLIWDYAHRYGITFTDTTGQRWETIAYDVNLSICDLNEDPTKVWATFGSPRRL
jgi:hypothetical protein